MRPRAASSSPPALRGCTEPAGDRAVLRRDGMGLRLDPRRAARALFARAPRRGPGLDLRPGGLAWSGGADSWARRAGRSDPAPRPARARLGCGRRAARRPAAPDAVRRRSGRAVHPIPIVPHRLWREGAVWWPEEQVPPCGGALRTLGYLVA